MGHSVGILTISDRGARGDYIDKSGGLIRQILEERTSWSIVHLSIVPDERQLISERLLAWCGENISLVLTTGGTGFAPRDVTPEATRAVLEREAPGIAEALRAESLKITKHAMLSRGVAGIRGQTLIVNLPGSPKAVRESLEIIMSVLPHALDLLWEQSGTEQQHRSV